MGFSATQCTSCYSNAISRIVSENHLHYWCHDCKQKLPWPLVKVQKTIIYLDQNFYSHSFRKKKAEFSNLYSRLEELAKKQLIVCPYSETHVKETLSLPESERENFWLHVMRISCNKKFEFFDSIKEQQIIHAYIEFMVGTPSTVNLRDATKDNFHDWCFPLPSRNIRDSFKSIVEYYNSNHSINTEKDSFLQIFYQALTIWGPGKNFNDDFNLEIEDHIRYLLSNDGFVRFLIDLMRNYFPAKAEEDIIAFFKPHIFSKIPHVNIAAHLWALIKQDIRANPPKVRIIEKYRGISFDIDFLSTLFPYCDAIFTENRMAEYLRKFKRQNPNYQCTLFSARNINDFHLYLDEIETNMQQDLADDLKLLMATN